MSSDDELVNDNKIVEDKSGLIKLDYEQQDIDPEKIETSLEKNIQIKSPKNSSTRQRDPLRFSRFLSFPSDNTSYSSELSQNCHDVRLTRAGFYGIRLQHLTESAWDSLYLGIGRMKAVVDFEVIPPPSGLFDNSPRPATASPSILHTSPVLKESNGRLCLSSPEENPGDQDLPQEASIEDARLDITPYVESTGPLEKKILYSNVVKVSSTTSSASSLDEEESNRINTLEVITGKGQLIAKAQQEKIMYFFVSESQSLLKLQVHASLSLGMRLKCSYDLWFCGTPKLNPSNSLMPYRRNVNILSLDGGGILGISSVRILERLELEIQKELCDPNAKLADCFDIICGTSTGGIISLGLLTGMEIKDMMCLWASLSGRIFEGNRTLFSGVFFEGYDVTRLKDVLCQSLGQRFLNTYTKPYCFVTSTDVKHNPYELFLLRNYSHHHLASNEIRGCSAIPVWTAAWATSAAPTYLKGPNPEELQKMGFIIHPEVQLCDGALKANNPTLVALEESARLSGKKLQNFIETELDVLLSIGTGQPTLKPTIEKSQGAVSTFQILLNSTHLLTSATTVHREVLHWLGDQEDRYFRFNVPGIGDIPLDSCEKNSHDLILKATNDYLIDEKYYDIRRLVKKLSYRFASN